MRTHSLRLLLSLVLLFVPCFGQLSNGGEVVDVVDGRTMIVATGGGRVKVELQFIEVPEAGEQFYDAVKGHLRRMLVGKAVEFKPREILSGRVIGRVFLNNVDVSQQMLRDGAAHHVPRERSRQDKNQFDAYASTEALAKTEKRGVWSIVAPSAQAEKMDPTPPRPVLAAVKRGGSTPALGVLNVPTLESWVAALPVSEKENGLKTDAGPSGRYSATSTPFAVLEFASDLSKQKAECRGVYAAVKSLKGLDDPMFLLGCRAPAGLKLDGSMTVVVERYVVPLVQVPGATETRYYRISKAFLTRIANTRSVEFQIGGSKATLSEDAKEFFRQLLAATD